MRSAFGKGEGARFIDALARAASRGLRVKVLVDGLGSARSGLAVAAALREAGCEARVYHRLVGMLVSRFGRNHRKILLVDDEVALPRWDQHRRRERRRRRGPRLG